MVGPGALKLVEVPLRWLRLTRGDTRMVGNEQAQGKQTCKAQSEPLPAGNCQSPYTMMLPRFPT